MDEALWVVGKYDTMEWAFISRKIGETVVGLHCNRHRPLLTTSLKANDDVLLQHFIVPEWLAARLEEVYMADGRMLKDEFAERAIVRPIAKAARNDRHNLAARRGLRQRQRDEGRIQIHSLNTNRAQGQPVNRVAVDLLVRWVENCVGIFYGHFRKQVCR